ncbi:NapC/NirT family cytochrome c [Opitutus terrae]|uniref:Cytochrome c family protein n=1 Tax=Opitutus terrae (strain DSM 11246 / JCM 15787 / PB90-1) TaxID=452637 RepID=B1ZTY4_OPITP|nr:NapC/NirT family cytochrome c [Opitutus terrae]ACB75866.1 cytochrome c family protein [Opitutus terrae PB90-1]
MSTPSSPASPLKPRSAFNNWISAIGAVLSLGALFSFAFLVWMDFSQGEKNPYLGILTYIVAPMFLMAGLALLFGGAWLQRRYAIKHAQNRPDRWQVDFSNRRQRRIALGFGFGGILFLVLSAFGSYQTYHYSESTQFCGQVCHEAMNPEFVTYQRGEHARVDCVECHIGSGAEWFIKAKINGTHQLIAYALDNYNRPIATPLHNLRPAQDICEKCHWPEKFHGNIEINFDHFLSNKKNTPYTARMLMHVNASRPGGPAGGIHWHVNENEKVEYYAADAKRQEIPWMRVTNVKTGASRIYRTDEFTGEPPVDQIRVMDCMDCHNRPAHMFPTANEAVERALLTGTLSTALPNIKRDAVNAMTQEDITTSAGAPEKIAAFLTKKYAGHPDLPGAIAAVQSLYATTIFPERKADWRVYPNNIGHKDWPGCFRCHDDKHKTASGQTVSASDCTSCHTIIAQGKGEELALLSAKGLEFEHPGGEYDAELTCADCHNGGVQK